jgi:hypothetical protein
MTGDGQAAGGAAPGGPAQGPGTAAPERPGQGPAAAGYDRRGQGRANESGSGHGRLGRAQADVYAAEAETLDHLGIVWPRRRAAQAYLDHLLGSAWFGEQWPHFVACTIELRGDGAAWSTNHPLDAGGPGGRPTEGVLLITRTSLTQPVVLHELAHLLAPVDAGHGPDFVAVHLTLVRREMGIVPFADYLHALRRREGFRGLPEPALLS